MKKFMEEVKKMPTADIMLILEDQLDLYSKEEIDILQQELSKRPDNALEMEEKDNVRQQEALINEVQTKAYNERERTRFEYEDAERKSREAENKVRIDRLRKTGHDGYYEYKAISLQDEVGVFGSSGWVDIDRMTEVLNDLGLDGWRLVSAYSNEIGKNTSAAGIGGAVFGTNATVDENILIFERYVKLEK